MTRRLRWRCSPRIEPRPRSAAHVRSSRSNRSTNGTAGSTDGLRQTIGERERAEVGASIVSLSACQDNQVTPDGNTNGFFTYLVMTTWNRGGFTGDVRQFHRALVDRARPDATPVLGTYGRAHRRVGRSASVRHLTVAAACSAIARHAVTHRRGRDRIELRRCGRHRRRRCDRSRTARHGVRTRRDVATDPAGVGGDAGTHRVRGPEGTPATSRVGSSTMPKRTMRSPDLHPTAGGAPSAPRSTSTPPCIACTRRRSSMPSSGRCSPMSWTACWRIAKPTRCGRVHVVVTVRRSSLRSMHDDPPSHEEGHT